MTTLHAWTLVLWGRFKCRWLNRHRFGGWYSLGYGIAICADCKRTYTTAVAR